MWSYLVYRIHLVVNLVPLVLAPLKSDFLPLVVLVEVLGVGPDACPSSSSSGGTPDNRHHRQLSRTRTRISFILKLQPHHHLLTLC
jgi:hypothetical protein